MLVRVSETSGLSAAKKYPRLLAIAPVCAL